MSAFTHLNEDLILWCSYKSVLQLEVILILKKQKTSLPTSQVFLMRFNRIPTASFMISAACLIYYNTQHYYKHGFTVLLTLLVVWYQCLWNGLSDCINLGNMTTTFHPDSDIYTRETFLKKYELLKFLKPDNIFSTKNKYSIHLRQLTNIMNNQLRDKRLITGRDLLWHIFISVWLQSVHLCI